MTLVRKIFLPSFSVSLLLCLTVAAQQERLFPLHSNAAIESYLQNHPVSPAPSARIAINNDTLQLPFIDDFSYDGVFPNNNMWGDSDVFINRDFPVDPPTLGVATFDGLNKLGHPYDPLGTTADYADHLTSKFINLNYPNDTTIWLSFFYQPQGLGEMPDGGDSLILEFINPANDSAWDRIWGVNGAPLAPFKQVMVKVDTSYLSGGFRFRFTNIANLNGNVDHWHVDYVRLDKNRSAGDTSFTNEGAFVARNQSLLKPPYTSIPYSHYQTNPASFMVNSETVKYKNLTASTLNFSHELRVVQEDGVTSDFSTGVNAVNANPYSVTQNTKSSLSYVFPSLPQPSLRYAVWNINTITDVNPQNDTVKETQVLDNYYSYDDGTAELAYGIYGAVPGAELAERFDLIMTDTLRGVNIYWNQFGPDVHNHLLTFAVWDQLTSSGSPIYKLIDQKPVNKDSVNGFYTYIFDVPIVVSGSIYIGWIQDDVDLLNIGFDVNTDNHDKLYFNVLGDWEQSTIPGTIMLRPLFGGPVNVGVKESNKADFSATVFPNPASGALNVSIKSKNPVSCSFQLFDATGRLVMQQKETTLNVSTLEDGFYLLKATDDISHQFIIDKVFVRH